MRQHVGGGRVVMRLLALTTGVAALCLLGDRLSWPMEPTLETIQRVSARVSFDGDPRLDRVSSLAAPRSRDSHRSRAPGREPIIRGVVVDARGAPVAGVKIRVGYPDAKVLTETDDRGRFALSGHPRGRAEFLFFGVPGGAVLPGSWAVSGGTDDRIVLPDTATVRILAPSAARGDPGGTGFAVLPDRRNLRNGEVPRVRLEQRPFGGDGAVYTLPAGRVIIRFSARTGVVAADLELEAGKETELQLGPSTPVRISGRVLGPDGAPVAGAWISDAWTGTGWAGTDDHGRIVAKLGTESVGPPIARLVVKKSGFAPHVLPRLDLRFCLDLHVDLTRGGTVSVQVDWEGAPPRWCEVVPLAETAIHLIGSRTNGEFPAVLEHVPPGPLRILIRPEGQSPICRTVHVCEGDTTHLTVTLPED
jgi:hypothetical protein